MPKRKKIPHQKENEVILKVIKALFKKFRDLKSLEWDSQYFYTDYFRYGNEYCELIKYIKINDFIFEQVKPCGDDFPFSEYYGSKYPLADYPIKEEIEIFLKRYELKLPTNKIADLIYSYAFQNSEFHQYWQQGYLDYGIIFTDNLSWNLQLLKTLKGYFIIPLEVVNRINYPGPILEYLHDKLFLEKCYDPWIGFTTQSSELQHLLYTDTAVYMKKMVKFMAGRFKRVYKEDTIFQSFVELTLLAFEYCRPYFLELTYDEYPEGNLSEIARQTKKGILKMKATRKSIHLDWRDGNVFTFDLV